MEPLRRIKVLLVDDEAPILVSTRLLLEDLGFDVLTTDRVGDVLPLLESERPDVLLQDLRMPGLDLRDLLTRIRQRPLLAGTRIILFSASLDIEATAEEAGVACLEKPFRPQQLVGAIRDAVAA